MFVINSHSAGVLVVICSCLIISSVANDGWEYLQECTDGVCVQKSVCPTGTYDETNEQVLGIITLRVGEDNACRNKEVCCKNVTRVPSNKECTDGVCVQKTVCPTGTYDETNEQVLGIITLRVGEDNVCQKKEVCCRKSVSTNPIRRGPVKPTRRGSPIPTRRRIVPAENACGVHNPDGIANDVKIDYSTFAKYGEYPWVVAIFQEETIRGGGTLIHPWFVLSAAHIFPTTDNFFASFGEWNLTMENNPLPKQIIAIQSIFFHPEYREQGLRNDIALAHLKREVRYDEHIRPICLPSPTDLFDNQLCIATGWGRNSSTEVINVLKRVTLPVIPRERCIQLFAATRLGPFFRLHDSVLCAGAEAGGDMCDGDGGSGLFCPTESGSLVLVGVVSWGLGCHRQNVPGAYVNVAKFVPWINSTIGEYV